MDFDWNEKKREINWEKHKIDLLYVSLMFETPESTNFFLTSL